MPITPVFFPFIFSIFLPFTAVIGKNDALPKLFFLKCSTNFLASSSVSVTIFCKLAPKHISIAVSYSLGTEIIFANTPCIPFPSSLIFSQSNNSDFTLLIYPSFSFSVSTKKLYLDCFILISFVLLTICKSYSFILLFISCFLLSISSIAFNILFLSASI